MFSVEKGDESACTIGVPSRAPTTSLNGVKSVGTSIGGQAVWNDEGTTPAEGSIKCRNCGDSSKMVLVSQIYAPIESDRTLYVFCCNSRTCSLTSSGWVVVRNQEKSKDVAEPVKAESASVWDDFLAPTEKTSTVKAASAWGDFSFEEESADASVDALTALLQERDLSLNAKATEKKTTSTAKTTSSSTSRYTTVQQLTCWEVSELEESWTAADEEAAWEGLGADEDTGASGGDEYINRLLKSYYEGEEDAEIVNIVKKQQQGGAAKASEPQSVSVSAVKAPTTTEKTAKKGPVKKPSARANDSDGESSDEEGGEVGLARGSRRQQVEAYFQRRVSFYPTQVLRYAYGGAPLWISHPSPLDAPLPVTPVADATLAAAAVVVDETVFQLAETKKSKKNKPAPTGPKKALPEASHIPRCEGCGKARVFECQLMPALLSYISTSSSSSKEVNEVKQSAAKDAAWNFDHPPTAADILRFQETLGDELDFGVVAIYSCPDSCANCTEVAIVQGPPDIL